MYNFIIKNHFRKISKNIKILQYNFSKVSMSTKFLKFI